MSTTPHDQAAIPVADEAREAMEAARREGRELTETERAIAGAEAMTTQEALASIEAAQEREQQYVAFEIAVQAPGPHRRMLRLIHGRHTAAAGDRGRSGSFRAAARPDARRRRAGPGPFR